MYPTQLYYYKISIIIKLLLKSVFVGTTTKTE